MFKKTIYIFRCEENEILVEDIPKALYLDKHSKKDLVNFIKYQKVSEFPVSARDFSFSIKNLQQYNIVISHIEKFHDKNLKDFFIFDFYLNEKLGEIKVGVRLIFQSPLKTLSDEEIQKSIDKILKPIINLDGVFIPGLEFK